MSTGNEEWPKVLARRGEACGTQASLLGKLPSTRAHCSSLSQWFPRLFIHPSPQFSELSVLGSPFVAEPALHRIFSLPLLVLPLCERCKNFFSAVSGFATEPALHRPFSLPFLVCHPVCLALSHVCLAPRRLLTSRVETIAQHPRRIGLPRHGRQHGARRLVLGRVGEGHGHGVERIDHFLGWGRSGGKCNRR